MESNAGNCVVTPLYCHTQWCLSAPFGGLCWLEGWNVFGTHVAIELGFLSLNSVCQVSHSWPATHIHAHRITNSYLPILRCYTFLHCAQCILQSSADHNGLLTTLLLHFISVYETGYKLHPWSLSMIFFFYDVIKVDACPYRYWI